MKQIILFLSLLFAVQIGTAQDTWNACNSTVTIIPAPSYDSTFVLEAPSRAALQKGMANWVPAASGGGGASYLVYTALLTQTGTDAPVATVLENTLGGTVVWSYNGTADFRCTLTGAFPTGKTIIFTTSAMSDNGDPPHRITCFRNNDNSVILQTFDANGGLDGVMSSTYPVGIEIRVYP